MSASIAGLLGILGAISVGAMSPGPSFLMVVRTAVSDSRRAGLTAAVGMGMGAVVLCIAALLGLHAVLTRAVWLFLALKIAGGAYLVFLAVGMWRGAATPFDVESKLADSALRPQNALLLSFVTQVSNPKAIVVYGSIFAALLPVDPPSWMTLALPPLIFMIEAGWYTIVALAFSATRPQRAYLHAKRWIDRGAGSVMGVLGVHLMWEGAK